MHAKGKTTLNKKLKSSFLINVLFLELKEFDQFKVATKVGIPRVIAPPKVSFFIANKKGTINTEENIEKQDPINGTIKLIPEKKNLCDPKPKDIFK